MTDVYSLPLTEHDKGACDLSQRLLAIRGYEQNTVFSPYGIQLAMDRLLQCTSDAAIQAAVGAYGLPQDESLKNTNKGAAIVLYQKKHLPIQWLPSAKQLLQYVSASEQVSRAKNALMQCVFQEPMSPEATPYNEGLHIFTAVRYTAKWRQPFNKYKTWLRPFTLGTGKAIAVTTMSSDEPQGIGLKTPDYDMAALAGNNGSIAYFIKPKKNPDQIGQRLADIISQPIRQSAILEMPKLTVKNDLPLIPLLEQFPPLVQAEFMLDKIACNLFGKVKGCTQTAQLDMDEEKTVAIAFTHMYCSCVYSISSQPPQPLRIRMDSPYFIVIKDTLPDTAEGRIVFVAWIADPRCGTVKMRWPFH